MQNRNFSQKRRHPRKGRRNYPNPNREWKKDRSFGVDHKQNRTPEKRNDHKTKTKNKKQKKKGLLDRINRENGNGGAMVKRGFSFPL